MAWSLLSAVVGALFLAASFRLIEARWPASYISVSDYASYRKMTWPVSYLVFRFLPVFLVALFGAVNLERAGHPVWPFVVVLLVVHAAHTSGIAGLETLRSAELGSRRGPLLALHSIVIALVAGTAILGALLRGQLEDAVPAPGDVLPELWGAAAAATVAAALVAMTASRHLEIDVLVAEQRRRVGSRLLSLARDGARQRGVDPVLVEAIMLAESLQRPRWFRGLERLKGRVYRKGTYGIMQVTSDRPLSDEHSLGLALHGHLADLPAIRNEDGHLDYEAIDAAVRQHNDTPDFVELVRELMYTIERPSY